MNHQNRGSFLFVLVLPVLVVLGILIWLTRPINPSDAVISGEPVLPSSEPMPTLPTEPEPEPPSSPIEVPISNSIQAIRMVPEGRFNYGGSATMVPIRQSIELLIAQEMPKFQLEYVNPDESAPNSTTGIDMLLAGDISFSDSSRSIRPEEYETAERLGYQLKQEPVAIDGIAITIHPDLNIEGLTLDQLKAIYLGTVKNWSELGGPDLDIVPISMLPSTSGTANFFTKVVLDGYKLADSVQIINETTPALRKIADTPGSLYYLSTSLAVPQCSIKTLPIASAEGRPFVAPYISPMVPLAECPDRRNQINKNALRNGSYPLTRRLFVIRKLDNSADDKAGAAYSRIMTSDEGQSRIEQAGFVSIR